MIRNPFLTVAILMLIGGLFQVNSYGSFKKNVRSEAIALIPLLTSKEILNKIDKGAKVIFVDAREREEFAEDHLPGAINMTLRQVNRETAGKLRDADLIVTYCLKDFRGFELGRALKNQGLGNVRLMKAHGIYGWKKQALPVTSRGGMTDAQSIVQLRKCAADINDCITLT